MKREDVSICSNDSLPPHDGEKQRPGIGQLAIAAAQDQLELHRRKEERRRKQGRWCFECACFRDNCPMIPDCCYES